MDSGIFFDALRAALAAFWIYLPAFVANAVPVMLIRVPGLREMNRPIWALRLGSHKTWVGLIGGIVCGVIVGGLQIALTPWPFDLSFWLLWSAVISFGALLGDSVKSYFKRRVGIPPGQAWPVFDGVDYVLGALIVGLPLFLPAWQIAVALIVIGPILSLLASMIGYGLGLKRVWY